MRYDPLLQEGNAVVKLERNVDIDLLGCTNTSLFLTIDYDQGDEKTEFTCSECYLLFTSSTSLGRWKEKANTPLTFGLSFSPVPRNLYVLQTVVFLPVGRNAAVHRLALDHYGSKYVNLPEK
jgi:hypothetical protein